MKVIVEHTRFVNDQQIDLNYLNLQKYNNIFCIATREAQIKRIQKWLVQHNINTVKVWGWWQLLKTEYLEDFTSWKKHDLIIFLDPDRCNIEDLYLKLIDRVSLC